MGRDDEPDDDYHPEAVIAWGFLAVLVIVLVVVVVW